MKQIIVTTLIWATLFTSCRRDNLGSKNCEILKEGIATNDIDKVKAEITHFIAALPSSEYNAANISQLCQRISSSCSVLAESLCFDCIKTLPSQSEIRITFGTGASSQTKVIDLTYTAGNKIVVRNMHD